ncbi:ABC transporter ATP-binding protein [Comamonas sp. JUb58]|uniref:ABC transporter ATP-binding protein n=1 Tax=Comamonas sp. JUb58 TaxID=2485114 RepID=UPI00105ED0CA|nr:ABC transporter ATP-binding protein [Comamonas sp. JUb58]TDS71104.1 iron complex transport system ATP-binding protein [Comamonas sp. JUb58]
MKPPSPLLVTGLSVGYRQRQVIDQLQLPPLQPGQVTALVGPNGAGKSSLLKALAGLVPARGSLQLGSTALHALRPAQRAQYVGYMPQFAAEGVALTVLESLLAALRSQNSSSNAPANATPIERVHALLQQLGIAHLALLPLDSLSGGQRQLVSLAQSVIREPAILLLDEPTSALDLRHQALVMGTARMLAQQGRIVIAVLHDLNLAARWADALIVLRRGSLYTSGSPAQTLTPAMLAEVYGVQARVQSCSQGWLQIVVDGTTAGDPP